MFTIAEVAFYFVAFCILLLLLRIVFRFFRIFVRLIWGSGLLFCLNTFLGEAFSLGINLFTLSVAWGLGAPGVGVLLLLKHGL